jgi:hypothetical protein
MNFEPVRTLVDLYSLDHEEIFAGYTEYRPGDPEPGPNRGRAYWHGWRNAAMDHRELPLDEASAQLAHAVCPKGRFVDGYWDRIKAEVQAALAQR